jgi:hypothetical protein
LKPPGILSKNKPIPCNLALKWNIPGAQTNPAAGVRLFEANNARERFLTAEETQRLRDAAEKSKNPQLKTEG